MHKYVPEPWVSEIPDRVKIEEAKEICQTLQNGASERELTLQTINGKYWRTYGNDASDYTSPLTVFAIENFCPEFDPK